MRSGRHITATPPRPLVRSPSTYLYALLVAAVLGIGTSVLVASARDRATEIAQARDVVATLAAIFTDYTDRLLETADLVRNEAVALTVAQDAIARDEAAHRALAGLADRSPHVISIWIGDEAGDAILTSRTYPTPALNAADRPYFKAVRDDPQALHVGLLPDNRFVDEVLIVTARRIASGDGGFLGFAQVSLSPESIRDLVATTRVGYPISVYLFAPTGETLLRDPPVPVEALASVERDALLPAGTDRRGVFEAPCPLDGTPMIFGYAASPDTGIAATIGIPSAAVLAGSRSRLLVNTLAGTAMTLALALLAVLGAQAVRRQKAYALDLETRVEERTRALSQALAEKTLVLAEMGHRVKNAFATVQAVHRMSMRTAGDFESYDRDFEGRLGALAAAHVMIAESGPQERVSLHALVSGELEPYASGAGIAIEGEDVALDGGRAVALALVVHELATNAVKHGALSAANGRVAFAWRVEAGCLHLDWREIDGPPVVPPSRRGFGSRVLATSLKPHGGSVALDYAPDGLVARIALPLG